MDHPSPTASANVEAAQWLRERLSPFRSHLVTSVVPGGFAAYARVLHPPQVSLDGQALLRWSDVSRWSGVPLHSRIQWYEVALPEVAPLVERPWRGQGPRQGGLATFDADALLEDLATFTTTSSSCYFCLWVGELGEGTPFDRLGDRPVVVTQSETLHVVELPERQYALFEGHLLSGVLFAVQHGSGRRAANLWWPADHSWCVASEIDLAWTYVAGSRELIDRVLGDERVEAMEVGPEESVVGAVSGWLAQVIDRATDEVLATGSVYVALSLGDVQVTWQKRRLGRTGVLTSRSRRNDGEGSSTTHVRTRDPVELRMRVQLCVRRAVLSLVEL